LTPYIPSVTAQTDFGRAIIQERQFTLDILHYLGLVSIISISLLCVCLEACKLCMLPCHASDCSGLPACVIVSALFCKARMSSKDTKPHPAEEGFPPSPEGRVNLSSVCSIAKVA
jgi:hypothetical protein